MKPRITDLTKDLTTILYDNVTLKCSILANPPPHVTWTKNGAVIDERNVHLQDDNKTIFIERARLKNIGKYSCNAQNNLSSASKSLILSLKGKEIFLYTPNNFISNNLKGKVQFG